MKEKIKMPLLKIVFLKLNIINYLKYIKELK